MKVGGQVTFNEFIGPEAFNFLDQQIIINVAAVRTGIF
jgi:hypothetical protein